MNNSNKLTFNMCNTDKRYYDLMNFYMGSEKHIKNWEWIQEQYINWRNNWYINNTNLGTEFKLYRGLHFNSIECRNLYIKNNKTNTNNFIYSSEYCSHWTDDLSVAKSFSKDYIPNKYSEKCGIVIFTSFQLKHIVSHYNWFDDEFINRQGSVAKQILNQKEIVICPLNCYPIFIEIFT